MPFVTFPNLYNLMFFCWAEIISPYNWCTVVSIWIRRKCVSGSQKRHLHDSLFWLQSQMVAWKELSQNEQGGRRQKSPWLNPCSILGTYAH